MPAAVNMATQILLSAKITFNYSFAKKAKRLTYFPLRLYLLKIFGNFSLQKRKTKNKNYRLFE